MLILEYAKEVYCIVAHRLVPNISPSNLAQSTFVSYCLSIQVLFAVKVMSAMYLPLSTDDEARYEVYERPRVGKFWSFSHQISKYILLSLFVVAFVALWIFSSKKLSQVELPNAYGK